MCSDQVGVRGGYGSLQKGKANNSSKDAIVEKGEHPLEKAGSVKPRWMGLA